LEWAEITHPFHPRKGLRYQILKSRRVSGKETLILKDSRRGTFAVDRDWTNLADPCAAKGPRPPILDFKALIELVILIKELNNDVSVKAKERASPQTHS
jgi:hypothetical protein